jgi:hypothetical protein
MVGELTDGHSPSNSEVIEQEGVIFCDCKKSNKVYFVSALKKIFVAYPARG